MESPLSFFRMHWDHEPPLTRPPATLSPSDGEREGVRGRFMESLFSLLRMSVHGILSSRCSAFKVDAESPRNKMAARFQYLL